MKKILISTLICLLMFAAFVVAAETQKGMHEPGTGIAEPELYEENKGSGQGLMTEAEVQTQNKGEEQQLKVQQQEQAQVKEQVQTKQQARSGNYMAENGAQLQIQTQENNRIKLKVGNSEAGSSLELTQEQVQEKTRLHAKLSNGKNAEIKVMPDTASERAIERLRLKVCSAENSCSIELKEVGKGEQVRAAYEVQAHKESKVLGMFKKQMTVRAQVDAENGEVIKTNKPWWAFMASE